MSELEDKAGVPSGRALDRQDFERALESVDTFIDVTVDDLMALVHRAGYFAERRRSECYTVERIMSATLHTVTPQTSMSDAAHILVQQRISGLPVVGNDGGLVGIVTEADFLRGLGVPASRPTHTLWETLDALFGHIQSGARLERPQDPVSLHMERDVACVAPNNSIDEALALMKSRRVKRLVVCDESKQPLGMMTRSDLVRLFFDRIHED
ncbi:MAG: HPP family protein [Gammaproteobacteria bacterium]